MELEWEVWCFRCAHSSVWSSTYFGTLGSVLVVLFGRSDCLAFIQLSRQLGRDWQRISWHCIKSVVRRKEESKGQWLLIKSRSSSLRCVDRGNSSPPSVCRRGLAAIECSRVSRLRQSQNAAAGLPSHRLWRCCYKHLYLCRQRKKKHGRRWLVLRSQGMYCINPCT